MMYWLLVSAPGVNANASESSAGQRKNLEQAGGLEPRLGVWITCAEAVGFQKEGCISVGQRGRCQRKTEYSGYQDIGVGRVKKGSKTSI